MIYPEGENKEGYEHSIAIVRLGEPIYATSWETQSGAIKVTREGIYVDYKPFEVRPESINGVIWLVRIPLVNERPVFRVNKFQDIHLYRFEVDIDNARADVVERVVCEMGFRHGKLARLRGEPTPYSMQDLAEKGSTRLKYRFWIPISEKSGHEVPFARDEYNGLSDIEFYLNYR